MAKDAAASLVHKVRGVPPAKAQVRARVARSRLRAQAADKPVRLLHSHAVVQQLTPSRQRAVAPCLRCTAPAAAAAK